MKSVWIGMVVVAITLGLLAWTLSSLADLHDRLHLISPTLASVMLIVALVLLLLFLILGIRFLWLGLRAPRRAGNAVAPATSEEAAAESIQAARKQLELVSDEIAREALSQKLDVIDKDLAAQRYRVVVFGTGSAGKTSVVNALLGHNVGSTSPIVGTTLEGNVHEYAIDGFEDGQLRLVDTPGLAEIGAGGVFREEKARELAADADLLLFVVDQDLRDFEAGPLRSLATLGKRVVVVFNKRDLYPDEDLAEIREKLESRMRDITDEDVVVVAAAPASMHVRDSATGRIDAPVQPACDVAALASRLADILRQEGRTLLANTVLIRANKVARAARAEVDRARRELAMRIVRRFQWTTAGVLFVNPVPGLGALAAAAINYQMITEIAGVFGVSVSVSDARRLASELSQILLKMGVVTVSTELLGKALKATIVGYVAGGVVEATAGAYITRISGGAFIDYFAEDQDWGDGGMQGAIERHYSLCRKDTFIREFVKEAGARLLGSDRKERG